MTEFLTIESVMRVSLAAGIALGAHAGQTDKHGRPYIEHVDRVADAVAVAARDLFGDGETYDQLVQVAYLHDVVEDTPVTLVNLTDCGFDPAVVKAVEAITHPKHEKRHEYYARVAGNNLARYVKQFDVADNADPARLAGLPKETRLRLEQKYKGAYAYFG